jgi:hypothetical protein
MHMGTMIDDLMNMVERVEAGACLKGAAAPLYLEPKVQAYPLYSTFVYEWPQDRAMVGVA